MSMTAMKFSNDPRHHELIERIKQSQLWAVGFDTYEDATNAAENREVVCMRFNLDRLHDLAEGLTREAASFERWYSAEVLDYEFSMADLTDEDEWQSTFDWIDSSADENEQPPEIMSARVVDTGPNSLMAALQSNNEFENFDDWMKFANDTSFDAGIAALSLGITDAEEAGNRYLDEYSDNDVELLRKILGYVAEYSDSGFWPEAAENIHLLDVEQCIYQLKDEGHVEEDNGHWFRAY